MPELSRAEIERYSRHLIIPDVGIAGQQRLKHARVLVVGAGGLGSPLALYLAAAGVGHLGLVDFDVVDLTNLQRQVLHGTSDVGRPKLESARRRLADVNPHVALESYETRLTSSNALDILRGYDVVVDGTDNFATRYLVNDACVLLGIPNVYGSIFRFEGQASVFATAEGPCYRCLFREPPPPGLVPSCAEGGVLGVLPGLIGKLLLVDALTMQFRTLKLQRDPECPACGTHEIKELIDYEAFCGMPGSHDAQVTAGVPGIEPAELAARLRQGSDLDLVDVREPHEWEIGRLPNARLVPLGTLVAALSSFDPAREIVLYCRSGVRSAQAVRQLQAMGFRRVRNLTGGTLRWSDDVDSSVPKY